MKWYLLQPIDTLFFRTAEPMEIGESHDASFIFPPPVNSIVGAFRTLVLKENKIKYVEYYKDDFSNESIISAIGKSTDCEPFEIIGPFFKQGNDLFIPVPYCWFENENKGENIIEEKNDKYKKIIKGKILKSNDIKFINVDEDNFIWAKGEKLKSLGGKYIKINDFFEVNSANEFKEVNYESIRNANSFFYIENRTGIALEKDKKKAREGHIYSFPHIRLKKNVFLIVGINKDLPIPSSGILELGAEKRKVYYSEDSFLAEFWNKLKSLDGNFYMSLSLIKINDETKENMLATGKIQYLGGWDLRKKFHKPISGYYPAGTVFSKNIKNVCISIKIENL